MRQGRDFVWDCCGFDVSGDILHEVAIGRDSVRDVVFVRVVDDSSWDTLGRCFDGVTGSSSGTLRTPESLHGGDPDEACSEDTLPGAVH